MKQVLRLAVVAHRWTGIAGALLFAMWFASGIVMLHVRFPELTAEERFGGLEPIDTTAIRIAPHEALAVAELADPPLRTRMTMVDGRPAYHFLAGKNGWTSVYADAGTPVGPVAEEVARRIATRFAGARAVGPVDTIELDQWSVSESLRPFRPFLRVHLEDQDRTVLYVSARTGEVVRDTRAGERFWNYAGSVAHWLYPTPLIANRPLWHQVVVWTSTACCIVALTGLLAGVVRWRWHGRHRSGSRSPYAGWHRWHHRLGLLFAGCVLTWIVSGLLSMNPWDLFPGRIPDATARLQFHGDPGPLATTAGLPPVPGTLPAGEFREITWARLGDLAWLVGSNGPEQPRVAFGATNPTSAAGLDDAALAAGRRVLGVAALARVERVERYDDYYYAPPGKRPLPVLRVVFDDRQATWLHLDPVGGELLERMTRANRVQRWLYPGLHTLDFAVLRTRQTTRTTLVTLLCFGGFMLSVTGVVIGWRHLCARSGTLARLHLTGDRRTGGVA